MVIPYVREWGTNEYKVLINSFLRLLPSTIILCLIMVPLVTFIVKSGSDFGITCYSNIKKSICYTLLTTSSLIEI